MAIDIGTTTPGPDQVAAFKQLLIDALRNREAGAPLLRKLLADAKLTPEQQTFVDLLLESEHGSEEPTSAVVLEETDELEVLRNELADLRQANDTLAAALGACQYCWGGDRQCRVCRGRGRPGYAPPDAELFNELVLPAVLRVRTLQRPGSRPGLGRARA
jgi:hypothetical protein